LEFMIFSSVRTLVDAVRVIDRTAHPAAAILVDALHMQRSGATPADIAALPATLLPYAQLCDGPSEPIRPAAKIALSEARTGRLLPGDGELPLRQLIDALPADASLCVEAPVAKLAGQPPEKIARLAYSAMSRLLGQPSW
jgi:sugar phosphate isomerase/epimerase